LEQAVVAVVQLVALASMLHLVVSLVVAPLLVPVLV
jgi:hypothetical protein